MSSDGNTNAKISLTISQGVLDNALAVTGRNPVRWLQEVMEETKAARESGNAKEPTPSGFADLESREVEIVALTDRVMSSLADLLMFQAASPASVPPSGDSHPDPKTEIELS